MKLSQIFQVFYLSFLILSSVNSVASQSKQTEKRLSDTSGGYSFAALTGFDSQQNEKGFALVNTDKTVVIAVKNHNFKSFEEFSQNLNQKSSELYLMRLARD